MTTTPAPDSSLDFQAGPTDCQASRLRGIRAICLAQKLVTARLRTFSLGSLEIVYPNGESQRFGRGERYQGQPLAPARILLHRPKSFYFKLVSRGNIGLGESYRDRDWDSADLRALISWFILNLRAQQGAGASSARLRGLNLLAAFNRWAHRGRRNSRSGSRRNIEEHYDLGNAFYRLWLDPGMTYSSARFEFAGQALEDAQAAKYEELCHSLRLRPGQRVLEIGCGWGGFAEHAARHHGVRVTGVTISPSQLAFARERIAAAGLEGRVELRLQDYRDIPIPAEGGYDRIVSIEMLEAVGEEGLRPFFASCQRLLAPHGLIGLQMITVPASSYANLRRGVDFIQRHIFPGSLLLSLARIHRVLARAGDLFLHELRDLGADYAETLERWHANFVAAEDGVQALGFDEAFRRKWRYYLNYCAAAFATRNISVVQAVLTRPNNLELAHPLGEGGGSRAGVTPNWRERGERWVEVPVP